MRTDRRGPDIREVIDNVDLDRLPVVSAILYHAYNREKLGQEEIQERKVSKRRS